MRRTRVEEHVVDLFRTYAQFDQRGLTLFIVCYNCIQFPHFHFKLKG